MPSNYDYKIFLIQVIIILILGIIIIWLLKLRHAYKLDKRIGKFGVESLKKNDISIFDKLFSKYHNTKEKFTKTLYRMKIFNSYSKKYEKYIDGSAKLRKDPMNFIADKIFYGLLIVLLLIISDVLQMKMITFFEVITFFLIGFFTPDIYWISKEKTKKSGMKNDLLKAITIMNNAFKSGRTTIQAIKLVSTELDSPLAEEFKKMHIDLTYGLDLEVVFKRFSDRVDIDEVKYITTSLTILNKTGGNIVKVFASIEKNFFNNKKLEHELKSLSASSNALFKILLAVPLVITLGIILISPGYFTPLFKTTLGIIVLAIMIIIYITYIIIVKKVMRIKE